MYKNTGKKRLARMKMQEQSAMLSLWNSKTEEYINTTLFTNIPIPKVVGHYEISF